MTVRRIQEDLEKKYGKKKEYTIEELLGEEFAGEIRKTMEKKDEPQQIESELQENFLTDMEKRLQNEEDQNEDFTRREEIKIWDENVDNNQKLINTPLNSSSLSSGSSSESTEEEVGNINTNWIHFGFEDLYLANLFEEPIQQQPEAMALDIIKVRDFYGKPDEDVTEWVRDFNRAAEVNRWMNDDADNNLRLGMAKAHLKGDAVDWCETNDAI